MNPPGEEHGMDLVLPFVVTASHGGPYDDEAFVAGWAAGQLDHVLQAAAGAMVAAVQVTVRVALVPQLDLIAMRWGYRTVVEPVDDHWCLATFTTAHAGEGGSS